MSKQATQENSNNKQTLENLTSYRCFKARVNDCEVYFIFL